MVGLAPLHFCYCHETMLGSPLVPEERRMEQNPDFGVQVQPRIAELQLKCKYIRKKEMHVAINYCILGNFYANYCENS